MHIKQERRCIACRKSNHQNDMIRVSRFNGVIAIEKKHSPNGRGAYIKKSQEALEVCKKKKCFERVFECSIDNSIYEELSKYINE